MMRVLIMIKNCNCCGKYPKVEEVISCENSLCPEFKQEYFVYDWQELTNKDIDQLNDALKGTVY